MTETQLDKIAKIYSKVRVKYDKQLTMDGDDLYDEGYNEGLVTGIDTVMTIIDNEQWQKKLATPQS